MADYSGALPDFVVAPALAAVPLVPLLGGVHGAVSLLGWEVGSARRTARAAAWVGVLLALVAVAWWATLAPAELIAAPFTLLRVGSLDVSLALVLDVVSAPLALAIACAGALLGDRQGGSPRIGVATGAALLAVLADGVPLSLVGCGVLLLTITPARALFPRVLLGQALVLLGMIVLAWSLAGTWRDTRFAPELRERVIALSGAGARPGDARLGALSLRSPAQARVSVGGALLCALDGARRRGGLELPGKPCATRAGAPSAGLEIPAGVHNLEIDAGPGSERFAVEHVELPKGAAASLVVLGHTLSWRELRDQLAARDATGAFTQRVTWSRAELLDVPAVDVGLALIALGALLVLCAVGHGPLAPLAVVVALTWLVRATHALAAAPHATGWVALALTALSGLSAARAVAGRSRTAVVADLALATSLIAALAAAVGSPGAAAVGLAVTCLARAALDALSESLPDDLTDEGAALAAGDRRAHALALAAAIGAIPVLGASAGRDAAVLGAAASEGLGGVPGPLVAVLATVASLLAAAGAARLHALSSHGGAPAARAPRVASAWALLALAVGALAFEPRTLGLARASWVGVRAEPLLAVTPFASEPLAPGVAVGLAALCWVATLATLRAVVVRYGAARAKDWAARDARSPFARLLPAASIAAPRGDGLASLARRAADAQRSWLLGSEDRA